MKSLAIGLATAALIGICDVAWAQEDYTVVKAFGLEQSEGSPLTSVIEARDGNLYGALGGLSGIYRFSRDGTYTRFSDAHALFDLVEGSDGYLYGNTQDTLYRIALTGEYTVLAAFQNHALEGLMTGSVVEGGDGNFYGIARSVFSQVPPRIFKVTPTGVVSTVHVFDGEALYNRMVKGRDGALYGTTSFEGASRHGTIFRLDPDGTYTTLYEFEGAAANPRAQLLETDDGAFFGSTVAGGIGYGTIFRFKPGVEFSVIHQFHEPFDGSPSQLTEGSDHQLYGSIQSVIFSIGRQGGLRVLHRHANEAGGRRWGFGYSRVIQWHDGNFYGTARFGGPASGVLFRLNRVRSACTNEVELMHQGSARSATLYISQVLKSESAAVGGSFFVSRYGVQPFWLSLLPAITPAVAGGTQYEPFPEIGTVGVFSFILTADLRVCSAWKTVETGGPVTSEDELQRRLNSYFGSRPSGSR
jgi:uncharacterized repeat protein (TIGR03803 family)